MKTNLVRALLAMLALAFASQANAASKCWFWQLDCKVEEALADLDAGKTVPPTIQNLCRKGVAKKGAFSLRSFNGRACGMFSEWAAMYLLLCGKVLSPKEFTEAQCYKVAREKLGDANPMTVLKEKLEKGKGKALGVIKKLLCSAGKDLPGASLICGDKKAE